MQQYDHLVEAAKTLEDDALEGYIDALKGVLASRPKPKYSITVSATATVTTTVQVQASSVTKAEEMAIQLARDGDVIWIYGGLNDDTDFQTYDVQTIK